jgi:hypothetical protein
MQFFTGDWLKDPCLTICSPASRGVWIDLLSAMHESGRSGELRGTTDQLARLARCLTSDLVAALTELKTTGAALVTERNKIVTVTNRRMAREHKLRNSNAKRQERFREKQTQRSCNGVDPESDPESDPKGKEAPASGGVMIIKNTDELKRVEKRMQDIRGSYSEHQSLTSDDRAKLEPLKVRRKELMDALGWKY